MKLSIILLYCLVIISLDIFKCQVTNTYYVDISSTYADSDCGNSTATACKSISDLEFFNLTKYDRTLGENFIVLMSLGDYQIPNEPINLYGLNITFKQNSASDVINFDGLGVKSQLFSILELLDSNNETILLETIVRVDSIGFNNFYSNNSNGGVFNVIFNENNTLVLEIYTCQFDNNNLNVPSNTMYDIGSGAVLYFETGENSTRISEITIRDSQFTNSRSLNSQIFLNSSSAQISIHSSQFINNTARFASILYAEGELIMSGCLFQGNNADTDGGAIYLYRSASPLSYVQSSEFYNNIGGNGGAIEMYDSYLKFENCSFSSNTAMVNGGSIYVSGDDSVVIINTSTFLDGKAGQGGAVSLETNVVFIIENSVFQNNTAGKGGSIYLFYATGSLTDSPITSSDANKGGAIYSGTSKITIQGGQITYNSALSGGSIYCSASQINITEVVFRNNTDLENITSQEGGDIIPNDDNIFCSLEPVNNFCTISGDFKYTEYCGEQNIITKTYLSKGQVAGIVIGSVLGAALLAFGCAFFLTKKFSIKSYFTSLREDVREEDIESDN